jgi:hypothetical protein
LEFMSWILYENSLRFYIPWTISEISLGLFFIVKLKITLRETKSLVLIKQNPG